MDVKKKNPKLGSNKCQFCSCQNYARPYCEVKDKGIKSIKKDSLVPAKGESQLGRCSRMKD